MEDIEDSEFIASEHDRLVSAVSKLDKTQHITEPTRSEPTISNSEFNLIKRSNKLKLSDVAKVLEEKSNLRQISKKLKKNHDAIKVLPKPLEKPQAERIKRATGYEETKKKVGRWDPVVARSRTAEYAVFPIKHVETKLQPTNEFLARFELKSELERELEEVDPPFVIQEEVEEKIYPMSYEEMIEHRQHSARLRAQQSYKEAKAKRQSKIKSKKFHRVLKKERLKLQLKEFEELQKTNPEEALKKLESIEKARALERHTLRHKNTGKWAKNKMIRAKYDKDVRQQLAEQLAVSRGLTKKTQNVESSDDEDGETEGISGIALSQDPMNPWMLKQSNKSNVNAEFDFGYKKYLKDKVFKHLNDSESDSDDIEKEDNERGQNSESSGLSILKQRIREIGQKVNEADSDEDKNDTDNDNISTTNKKYSTDSNDISADSNNKSNKINVAQESTSIHELRKKSGHKNNIAPEKTISKVKNKKIKVSKLVATSGWVVEQIEYNMKKDKTKSSVDISSAFETLESNVAGQVEKKLKALRKRLERIEKTSRQTKGNKKQTKSEDSEIDNLEYLKLKNKKQKAVIDEALIETGSKEVDEAQNYDVTAHSKMPNAALVNSEESGVSDIDPNRFIEVKPKYLNTSLPRGENNANLLDDDEQVVPRVNIEEVFEEDDVVASFRQEKEDEINKDNPVHLDLTLPGWGSWGGKGVKAPKRKKNRFILKGAPKTQRRDENKGDIIIKEYKDPKLALHKVKEIPFPFNSVRDYEASIRAPLGNTFIPEKAHKKLIRPNVITKAGSIIEPMDEDELLVKRNRNFMNEKILKILGQK